MFKKNVLTQLLKLSEELSNRLSYYTVFHPSSLDSIFGGLHNTRKTGRGEEFLQFREFKQGDYAKNIDWRKSASSNKLLIREKEKTVSDNIYIHVDNSESMLFKSMKSSNNKFFNAHLIALTLCRIFTRNKEQVFIFNNKLSPIKCSSSISNFNVRFLETFKENLFPNVGNFKKNSLCIIISDFFYKKEKLTSLLSQLKKKSIKGLLMQILDPAEFDLKFNGNIKLIDMETNSELLISNPARIRDEYKKNFFQLTQELSNICEENHFAFFQHNTKNTLNELLNKAIKSILMNKKKID